MTPPPNPQAEIVKASFRIAWEGRTLEASVPVPTAPISPRIMLPVIQQLTNALVGMGENLVESRGEKISCKAGCGACCRQLVPVSETEARHLHDLIEAMPEPRRTTIRERFAAAIRKLTEAGLVDILEDQARALGSPEIGMVYFRQGIACPFLEDESCSIHPDRPLSCREYLVTSPAENCRDPSAATVRRVPTPGFAVTSFAVLDGPTPSGKGVKWIPLILAPGWAADHPEPPPTTPGTELFARFMTALTKLKKTPPPVEAVPPSEESAK